MERCHPWFWFLAYLGFLFISFGAFLVNTTWQMETHSYTSWDWS